MPRFRSTLAALAAGLLAACSPTAEQAGVPRGCMLDPPADVIGGPIALVDQTGAAVTQTNFAGRPALVYFGFTYCPDVCPLALQSAKAALEQLGPAGAAVQPILVSLDPERDTPAQLGAYVGSDAFPAGTVGLTGTPEQTAAAASTFKVAWRRNDAPDSAADYLIDHSSFFYVMDPQWRLAGMYPSTLSVEEQATCLGRALAAAA